MKLKYEYLLICYGNVVSVCMFVLQKQRATVASQNYALTCSKLKNVSFPVHNVNGFISSIGRFSGALYRTVFGEVVLNSLQLNFFFSTSSLFSNKYFNKLDMPTGS